MSILLVTRATTRAIPRCGPRSTIGFAKSSSFSTVSSAAAESSPKAAVVRIGDNSNSLFSYGVFGGLAVTILGGLKFVHDHVGGTEGLARTMSFYSLAIPKYIEYRMHMMKDSSDEVWDDLHEDTSKIGLKKILELRGFYIKSGQMCAVSYIVRLGFYSVPDVVTHNSVQYNWFLFVPGKHWKCFSSGLARYHVSATG
mmetsp:Transcript_31701/g.94856  ORF Transcript_31701/g.94856 Transcript_31701/m.94856 type:complete len:198 (-) Transcript_31701:1392-1985(-)